MLIFCILVLSFTSVFAQSDVCNLKRTVKIPGACPQITYIGFGCLEATQGLWYRPYSTENLTAAGCDGDCISGTLSPYSESAYQFVLCCKKKDNCGVICGPSVGSGTLAYHPLNVGGSTYNVAGNCTATEDRFCYILDTDSITTPTFLIIYCCTPVGTSDKLEYIYVYTRDQTVPQTLVQRISDVLASNNLDSTTLLHSAQGGSCPYVTTV